MAEYCIIFECTNPVHFDGKQHWSICWKHMLEMQHPSPEKRAYLNGRTELLAEICAWLESAAEGDLEHRAFPYVADKVRERFGGK